MITSKFIRQPVNKNSVGAAGHFGILNLLAPKADITSFYTPQKVLLNILLSVYNAIIQLSWQAVMADCIGN